MSSVAAIAPEHSESLLRVIEAAAEVRRRYQFFLWTQADVQRLLPHKLAICGAYDRARRDLAIEALYSVPLSAELLESINHVQSPLVQQVLMLWVAGRQQPVVVDLLRQLAHDGAAQRLVQLGYQRLLVHAVCRPGRPTELESFFIFGSPDTQPTEADARTLALLMPYLHATYLRVHSIEREMSPSTTAPMPVMNLPRTARAAITEREREILCWVRDGKSNQEIGEALQISALTVKNHVQKILRKLGAANRAQAVAKALSMNLLVLRTEDPPMR